MLRERIKNMEAEINLQNQMIKERDMKLKERDGIIRRMEGEAKTIANQMEEERTAETAHPERRSPVATRRFTTVRQIRPGEEDLLIPTPERRADVRHLFNRPYDEL